MAIQPYKLSPGGLITVYEIDFSKCLTFTPTGTTVLRLSPYRNGISDIVYAGNTYQYVGVSAAGFRSENNSAAPRPQLTFDKASLYSNATFQAIRSQFATQTGQVFFDWRGATAKITKYYANGTDVVYNQEYIVDQVNTITKDTVEVSLTVSLAIDTLGSDSIQTLSQNRCSLKYRTWNGVDFDYTADNADGCPYGNPGTPTNYSAVPSFGIKFFTSEDVELLAANKQFDACSQTVKGCQLRFDPNKVGLNLPFKGLYSPSAQLGE